MTIYIFECQNYKCYRCYYTQARSDKLLIPALDTVQDFLCELDMKPHRYASSGNHHLAPESRQKLGTFRENKVFQKSKI